MKTVVSLIAILVYFLIQSTGEQLEEYYSTCDLSDGEELEGYFSPCDFSDDEEVKCRICLDALDEETRTLKCCNTKYCKKCITSWLNTGVDRCPLCFIAIPNLCYACKSDISGSGKKYVTTCCKRILCYNCFLQNFKEKYHLRCPFCKILREKGKKFEVIKLKTLCNECKTKKGKYSYSSICPHVFCKECFKKKKKENANCPYCNQPLIRRQDSQCSCCFEAISNKTETIKHCKTIFCKSCILSSLKIKGNTSCLICSGDVITTTCHLCDSIIPEDHGKIYLTKCCKKRLCFSCFEKYTFSPYSVCLCCEFYHGQDTRFKMIMLKKKCKKCNTNKGKYSLYPICPDLYCKDCIKTINKENHICKH